MRVGIAADHQGFELKETLLCALVKLDFEMIDYGAYSPDPSDDYPKFVQPLAQDVASFALDRGIAICGSGIGACIAANKVVNARASVVHDILSARQGVEDDDMNILCLGARLVEFSLALKLTKKFLGSHFSGLPRHLRRLEEISNIERMEFRK